MGLMMVDRLEGADRNNPQDSESLGTSAFLPVVLDSIYRGFDLEYKRSLPHSHHHNQSSDYSTASKMAQLTDT